jgi:hypothetical protein
VSYPIPLNNDWKARVDAAGAQALIIPVTRSRPAGRDVNDDDDVTQANKKRKRTVDAIPVAPVVLRSTYEVLHWITL